MNAQSDSTTNVLLIFVKNPKLGFAKTRIAQSVGDQKAFDIYNELLSITHDVTNDLECRKHIYYSDFIDDTDIWNEDFVPHIQHSGDLGERMSRAFEQSFNSSNKVLIIGSDCPDLTPDIINEAFVSLENNDVVIGPSSDGGYYLLGMNAYYPTLFRDISWSTETVCEDTLEIARSANLKVKLLQELTDVDYYEDWISYLKAKN